MQVLASLGASAHHESVQVQGQGQGSNKVSNTALLAAIEMGQTQSISALVTSADTVDFETQDRSTALIRASELEQLDIMQTLVDNGESVDYETQDGRTALIQAVCL